MGRKPKAPRVGATANVVGTPDPSLKMVENEEHMKNPATVPAKSKHVIVRRSGRIRNPSSSISNKKIIVEEVDIVDSDGQDEPHVEELSNEPQEPHNEPDNEELSKVPISNQQGLEEKVDFLVQSVKDFKSKATKRSFPSETEFTEFNYKSLYIDSQKKIESLLEENHQLAKRLEFALGEVKAYEQLKDVIGNLKDMILLSNLGKATEAVINFSSQTRVADYNLPAAGYPPPATVAATNNDEAKESEKGKRGRKKK